MNETEARKRWAMLALIFATRIGLGFQFQAMGSVADDVAARLGLSAAETGTLIGLFLIPGLVLSIPAGFAGRYISDRMLVAFGQAQQHYYTGSRDDQLLVRDTAGNVRKIVNAIRELEETESKKRAGKQK